jgi:hypothetical protein
VPCLQITRKKKCAYQIVVNRLSTRLSQNNHTTKKAQKIAMTLLGKKLAQKKELSTKVPKKIAQTGWTINGKNQLKKQFQCEKSKRF